MIKNSDSNCEINTGCINKLKHVPEGCNLDLSNAPKNTKNGDTVWMCVGTDMHNFLEFPKLLLQTGIVLNIRKR